MASRIGSGGSMGPVSLGFDTSGPGGNKRRGGTAAEVKPHVVPQQQSGIDPLLKVSKPKPARESFAFKLRPRDIKEHLDRFVIRQVFSEVPTHAFIIAACA